MLTDVNLLGENTNIKNIQTLSNTSKSVHLEVNAVHVHVSSPDYRKNHYIEAANTSFENVEKLKCMEDNNKLEFYS
jgi:hypothetical protein